MIGIIIVLVLLAIIQFATIFVMRYSFRATNKRITNVINANSEVYANFKLRITLLNMAFKHLNCVKKELATEKKPAQNEENKEHTPCNNKDETDTKEPSKPKTKKKSNKVKDN